MIDSPSMFQSQGLKLISYCPLCSMNYSIRDAKVLEENEDTHLMHVVCRRCSSSIIVLMLTGELGISSVGMVTDLTSEDVLKFKDEEEINSDDVLLLHEHLWEGSVPWGQS